ncbi:2-dehydro-3-deoxyphosphooctonate aldolase [Planctomycetales bacterium]|nr:2-dehydro-3-deoxyphosphooctonate aldolase [Planctomycetales bacterium]
MPAPSNRIISVGGYQCGIGCPLLVIAGPCALQKEYNRQIADTLYRLNNTLPVNIVFKGSFDKANRSSIDSSRGPGLETGLAMLKQIKEETGLPVCTDIHETSQAEQIAEVCDLLQIPAFLSRQTDLLTAAALAAKRHNRAVHIKKGQFMAPSEMKNAVAKMEASDCRNVLLGERGTFFGYGRLVNDMQALVIMRHFAPVVFDATHSVQEPAGLGKTTGGNREMIEPLARAAVAVGIDALFLETHPEPEKSPSDGPNMILLDQLENFLKQIIKIREAL